MFKYNVNAYFENAETTLRTNDVRIAINEFFAYLEDDVRCDIVDGTTGEVLAIANNPDMDNYTTEEMALMMLGYLMESEWGHAEAEEAECVDCEPADPVIPLLSALFGVSPDAVIALPSAEGLPS